MIASPGAWAASISGTILAPDGVTPAANITALTHRQTGPGSWMSDAVATSAADGSYVVTGLVAGVYRVQFIDNVGSFVGEFWNDQTDFSYAGDVVLSTSTSVVSGINAVLAAGGMIAGIVTNAAGNPLANISVSIRRWNGSYWNYEFFGSTFTDTDGTYQTRALRGGLYRVAFEDYSGVYAREWYDSVYLEDLATSVTVVTGAVTTGINASMEPGARIFGGVTDGSGTPLEGIRVIVQIQGQFWWEFVQSLVTDPYGFYDVGGLAPGTYIVQFEDEAGFYATEWYDNALSQAQATPLVLTSGATVSNVDAVLETSGSISGLVTEEDGVTPIADVMVRAYPNGPGSSRIAMTDASGEYLLGGLATGSYRVEFEDGGGRYIPEYYNNETSYGDAWLVSVTAGTTTTGITASLAVSARVAGRVTALDGITPLNNITVIVDGYNNSVFRVGSTDTDGAYVVGGFGTGQYRVRFEDDSGIHALQWYSNAVSSTDATILEIVQGETVTNIDARLGLAGSIAGTVTAADDGAPIYASKVEAYRDNGAGGWSYIATAYADSDGSYVLSGLPPGTYRLFFEEFMGLYNDEWYDGVFDESLATAIPLAAGDTLTGIDATLEEQLWIRTTASFVVVPEGGIGTFQVYLGSAPAGAVTVAVVRASGDADITVQGGAVCVFTPGTWSTPQTVTLGAAEDADIMQGSAVIECSAPGWTLSPVTAKEQENDLPPVGDAVDAPSLPWSTYGDSSWIYAASNTYDGVDAAEVGDLLDGESATLSVDVSGPGVIAYWWKVSSEEDWDYLSFSIDGVLQPGRISGEVDWQRRTNSIPAGAHTLTWTYSKDEDCCVNGQDKAWLDQVEWTPAGGGGDSNGNGVPDDWETLHFGGLGWCTSSSDWDNDRVPDVSEFFAGTDPTNALSFLRMASSSGSGMPAGGLVIRWQSVTGRVYHVDRSTNLAVGFQTLMPAVTGLVNQTTVTDTTASVSGPNFYRVGINP